MNLLSAPRPDVARLAASHHRSPQSWILGIGFWAVTAGLVALNGWWWWVDRPDEDLTKLGRMVGGPRNAEAERALARIVEKSPHDGEALLLLGRAMAARGDTRGGAEQLHRVPFWSPSKSDALYGEGLSWLEIHQARKAEEAFLQYLEDDPNHPETAFRPMIVGVEEKLLNLYALEDRWEDARDLIHRAHARAEPIGKPIWLLHGLRTYLERSHPAVSFENLRKFLDADPEDWEACRAFANAAANLKRDAEADRAIELLLEARPKDPKVWRDALQIRVNRDDFEGAEGLLAKAPPEAFTDGQVWFLRGQLLDRKGDLRGAVDAYRHSVALLPYDSKAHYRLSLDEKRLGHEAEAVRHGERHTELEHWNEELRRTLEDYNRAIGSTTPDELHIKRAIKRLAEVCRGLGLMTDAAGWDELLAPPKPAEDPRGG